MVTFWEEEKLDLFRYRKFSIHAKWPISCFLPALNLALFKISSVIRLTRAGTREIILQDYITFARAKGLSEKRIVLVHILKNILIPIVTVIGLEFGSLMLFQQLLKLYLRGQEWVN